MESNGYVSGCKNFWRGALGMIDFLNFMEQHPVFIGIVVNFVLIPIGWLIINNLISIKKKFEADIVNQKEIIKKLDKSIANQQSEIEKLIDLYEKLSKKLDDGMCLFKEVVLDLRDNGHLNDETSNNIKKWLSNH